MKGQIPGLVKCGLTSALNAWGTSWKNPHRREPYGPANDDSAPRPMSYIGGSVLPRQDRGFESVDFGVGRSLRRSVALEEEEALDTEQSKERAR